LTTPYQLSIYVTVSSGRSWADVEQVSLGQFVTVTHCSCAVVVLVVVLELPARRNGMGAPGTPISSLSLVTVKMRYDDAN
jgi:hypothetical protein